MSYGVSNVGIKFNVWYLYDRGQSNFACVVARSINPESGYNQRILLPRAQAADVVTALNECPELENLKLENLNVEFFYDRARYRSNLYGTYQIETEPLPHDQASLLKKQLNNLNITLPQNLVFPSAQSR